MAEYVVETSVLVDWLNGFPAAVNLLRSLTRDGHVLGVCSVSVCEVYSGVAEGDQPRIEPSLNSLDYWEISVEAAQLAGDFRYRYARQGIQISTPDALQAALAVNRDATLVTANVRDFPMPELKLLTYPD